MSSILSIVVPCFNEEASLPAFFGAFQAISEKLGERFSVDCDLILVNDGSSDDTLELLRGLASQDSRVHYLSFSRNFGKEAAIYAGLQNASGEYVVVMDADLQHPPEMLEEMLQGIIDEGYDCVAARRSSRAGESALRSFFSRSFYRLINAISPTKMVDGATDFAMMRKQMVRAILSLPEVNRFSKGIYSWVGFETKWLPYENIPRQAGQTTWSFRSLFLYSLQGILSFSTAPLAFASLCGLLLSGAAFFYALLAMLPALINGYPLDWLAVLICVICFLGGLQLFCLGILGQYLAKLYLEVKARPIFIVKETNMP